MTGNEVGFSREEKALRLLFRETTGAVLAFSLYTERAVRREITARLENGIAFPVHTVTLSSALADPTTVLASYPPNPRQCFVFFETEAAFPEFLGYVNFHREELLRSGHALLFWIREEGLRRISEEAPDFWAWRSRVFDFRTDRPVVLGPVAPSDATIGGYSATELGEQVSTLEGSGSGDLVTRLALGRRQSALKRYDEAERSLLGVVDKAERGNDQHSLAEGLYLLGNIALQQGRLTEAESYSQRSLAAAKPGDDTGAYLAATLQLAEVYLRLGDYEKSYEQVMQAVRMAQRLNDRFWVAAAYAQLGNVLFARGELREAEQSYLQAIEYEQELGFTPLLASTFTRLGAVYAEMGDTTRAQQMMQRSSELFSEAGFTDEAEQVQQTIHRLRVS